MVVFTNYSCFGFARDNSTENTICILHDKLLSSAAQISLLGPHDSSKIKWKLSQKFNLVGFALDDTYLSISASIIKPGPSFFATNPITEGSKVYFRKSSIIKLATSFFATII